MWNKKGIEKKTHKLFAITMSYTLREPTTWHFRP